MQPTVSVTPDHPENYLVSPDSIRSRFSTAMSDMYRCEVPAYGALLDLVREHNAQFLAEHSERVEMLEQVENLETLSDQRHGAIRIGKASELSMMRRIFAIMGMFPVGYYDLSVANVPVHSTAFRPIETTSIRNNPFRVFTSLLRLELIDNQSLREKAAEVLAKRDIFTDQIRDLVVLAEKNSGLNQAQVGQFISEIVNVFRWHREAAISHDLYLELLAEHPLIADVVSFKGPHINHLTPRTLDIDWIQSQMHKTGALPKAVIEGPPARECPLLLRQTAFLAIEEEVSFTDSQGVKQQGTHAARFGEIEQRGCALTPRGRALYDQLLNRARDEIRPLNDGSNLQQYTQHVESVFSEFPDNYAQIYQRGLGYFKFSLIKGMSDNAMDKTSIEALYTAGVVRIDPLTYEDFLPVSAAGIFQSNLGEQGEKDFNQQPNQQQFERDLGVKVADEFMLYAAMQQESIEQCLSQLGLN